MKRLMSLARLIWQADAWAMWRGALAALSVLLMGAALLGLSGWFITATGIAGLAGVGIAFDVFRPGAGVRGLSLGRAASRYAERVLTHDATLRALARLRLMLMRRLENWSVGRLRRLRSSSELTRITADVDALDGLILRLVLPVAAGLVTHLIVFAMLWWLSTPAVALSIFAGYVAGGGAVLIIAGGKALRPSAEAERAQQSLRRKAIDLFRGHRDVVLQGLVGRRQAEIAEQNAVYHRFARDLDRIDRRAGLTLNLIVVGAVAVALFLGGAAIAAGGLDAPLAALGVFVALALAETLLPLRRGVTELGRMHDAAIRVVGDDEEKAATEDKPAVQPMANAGVKLTGFSVAAPGRTVPLLPPMDLHVSRGEWVALIGPSGIGKSMILDALAGLHPALNGDAQVLGVDVARWDEPGLREQLTLLPQRAMLVSGSVRQNLSLATDSLTDDNAWAVLRAVELEHVVAAMGGLDADLSEGGGGLSGGQGRRLALARALLRNPAVLLLDEPTEGLDDALARQVVVNIRKFLPHAAVLMASHRIAEIESADRVIDLSV